MKKSRYTDNQIIAILKQADQQKRKYRGYGPQLRPNSWEKMDNRAFIKMMGRRKQKNARFRTGTS